MISVITVTFNNYDELRRTLDSIEGVPCVESVVINGGDCKKTAEYLSVIDSTTLSEPDGGISDAFNKGVRLAGGDAVMFLNSGDVLKEHDYPETADAILRNDSSISFVHADLIFTDSLCGDMLMKPALCSLGRGMPYYHQTMVVRRSVFNALGEFCLDYKIAMDMEFVCRMHNAGLKGVYWDVAPVVIMDGTGVSVRRETRSVMEGVYALRKNNLLNAENVWGFLVRCFFYTGRMAMVRLGLSRFLAVMKSVKHGRRARR